ncbi:Hsp20/alpha crystallin family protein [Saprospiraceae bacterium]|nr:Hsp20/alpha crystallin family protein [Saprospiraceae bacterium]
MNILNYTKPVPAKSFTNVIDDILNTGLSSFANSNITSTKPSVNIKENKENYSIELAAPGLKKEDFNITVEKDQLIIEAAIEKSTEETSEDGHYTRKEFNYGSFKRSFHLSDKINSEKIAATYEDGILTVKLDKREEAKDKAPRSISIS